MTSSTGPGNSETGHDRYDAFTGTNKKQRELAYCRPVVGRINHDERTDYLAIPACKEPADVLFRSASSNYPERGVQVVTALAGPAFRIDSTNVGRFKRALDDCLCKQGLNAGLMLTVALTAHAMRCKRPKLVELISELIVKNPKRGPFALMPDELKRVAPQVYSVAGYIGASRRPGHGGILWDIFRFEDFSRPTWDLEG